MSTDAPTSTRPMRDDTRNKPPEAAQAELQRQNDRLQLLLNLTNRITSNLELREVLRAISANIREVMQCDMAAISLPEGVAEEYANKQREEIVHALSESNGRVGGADGAAARLGINRTTLLSRMKKFGIYAKQYA